MLWPWCKTPLVEGWMSTNCSTERRVAQVMLSEYVEAYRRYCWPVKSLDDLKLAPFHILASEGKVHSAQSHTWHMDTLARLCAFEPQLLLRTPYKLVDVTNPESERDA